MIEMTQTTANAIIIENGLQHLFTTSDHLCFTTLKEAAKHCKNIKDHVIHTWSYIPEQVKLTLDELFDEDISDFTFFEHLRDIIQSHSF